MMIGMNMAVNHIDLWRDTVVALHATTPTELQDAALRAVIIMFQEVAVAAIVLEPARLLDVGREAHHVVVEMIQEAIEVDHVLRPRRHVFDHPCHREDVLDHHTMGLVVLDPQSNRRGLERLHPQPPIVSGHPHQPSKEDTLSQPGTATTEDTRQLGTLLQGIERIIIAQENVLVRRLHTLQHMYRVVIHQSLRAAHRLHSIQIG